MNLNKLPLEPYGNGRKDLFFWIKSFIGSKVDILKVDKQHRGTFKRKESSNYIADAKDIEGFITAYHAIRTSGLSNIGTYANPLVSFYRFVSARMDNKSIKDIGQEDKKAFFEHLNHEYKPRTRDTYMAQLTALIRYIEKRNIEGFTFGIESALVALELKKSEMSLLTPSIFRKVMEELEKYEHKLAKSAKIRLIYKFIAFGCIRGEEITNILLDGVSIISDPTPLLKGEYYKVTIPKKGTRARRVYIKKELIENDYREYLAMRPNCEKGYLFCANAGKGMTSSSVHQLVNRILQYAKVKNERGGIDLLRLSYPAYLASSNVDFSRVLDLFGESVLEEVAIAYKSAACNGWKKLPKEWRAI